MIELRGPQPPQCRRTTQTPPFRPGPSREGTRTCPGPTRLRLRMSARHFAETRTWLCTPTFGPAASTPPAGGKRQIKSYKKIEKNKPKQKKS